MALLHSGVDITVIIATPAPAGGIAIALSSASSALTLPASITIPAGSLAQQSAHVEPAAGDHVEDNRNPVGRAYYAFSTLLCTPCSLSQEIGLALGAQAGEARIRTPGRSASVVPGDRGPEVVAA